MKVEPGSSIEDSQGNQSNMAMLYAHNSDPGSFLECLSNIVPKTAQYQQDSVRDQILQFFKRYFKCINNANCTSGIIKRRRGRILLLIKQTVIAFNIHIRVHVILGILLF